MTPDEFLNIVRRHERHVNGWVGGARADLSHQDLSGLRLANANLQKAQYLLKPISVTQISVARGLAAGCCPGRIFAAQICVPG